MNRPCSLFALLWAVRGGIMPSCAGIDGRGRSVVHFPNKRCPTNRPFFFLKKKKLIREGVLWSATYTCDVKILLFPD